MDTQPGEERRNLVRKKGKAGCDRNCYRHHDFVDRQQEEKNIGIFFLDMGQKNLVMRMIRDLQRVPCQYSFHSQSFQII